MKKYCAENERIKYKYFRYMKQANGKDEQTLDKIGWALAKFEKSTNFKPFRNFKLRQAIEFKEQLDKATNPRTGKPLSYSTKDSLLRLVKGFFHWLAGQPGFRSRIGYDDVDYFNNSAKNARIARSTSEVPYPSIEAASHAFQGMQETTEIEMRDKAIFALFMLTGARDGAVASLKLKHVRLFDGMIFQDGGEVNTKFGKTISTWFYPVDPIYLESFENWVNFLLKEKLFSPEDALFPKLERRFEGGKVIYDTFSRKPYAGSAKMNSVVKNAFAMVQLPQYTPHSFRKTHGLLMSDLKLTIEEQKAWSLNLGHKNFATTVNSYLPVSTHRQGELLKALSNG